MPVHLEEKLRDEIAFMRKHDVPVTKPMILAMARSMCDEHQLGVTPKNKWYYGFLDSYDLTSGDTKPLESDRDLWLTSTVSGTCEC